MGSIGKLNTQEPIYTWHLSIEHETVPRIAKHYTKLDDFLTDELFYEPDFNLLKDLKGHRIGGIMGGNMTVSLDYYGQLSDKITYSIVGTNPGKEAIEKILTDPIARKIACQESQYRQFKDNREGGTGLPVVGEVEDEDDGTIKELGGVGIMQIYNPKSIPLDSIWNWQTNLKLGLEKYDSSVIEANVLHIKERDRLNAEREIVGLPNCPLGVPTRLSEAERQEDAIRRYNCGVEFRWEPRDAPNCEGKWVHAPSCGKVKFDENGKEIKSGYDEFFVTKVLACVL